MSDEVQIPYLTDQMETIVSIVSEKLLTELQTYDANILGVHYRHGHYREICETLKQQDGGVTTPFEKYPMVYLVEDIKFRPANKPGFYGYVNPQLIIAYSTDSNYKAEERYEKTFKPVLDKIYKELVKQVAKSGYYHIYDKREIEQPMVRRLFYGRYGLYGVEGNIFNDKVDVIEWTPQLLMYPPNECES